MWTGLASIHPHFRTSKPESYKRIRYHPRIDRFDLFLSESTVYRRTRLAADAALAGLGTFGGPYGAIGAFALDMTAKDSAVEWVTNEILKRSLDRVLTLKKRVDPK